VYIREPARGVVLTSVATAHRDTPAAAHRTRMSNATSLIAILEALNASPVSPDQSGEYLKHLSMNVSVDNFSRPLSSQLTSVILP
jgi:hypothetical protein